MIIGFYAYSTVIPDWLEFLGVQDMEILPRKEDTLVMVFRPLDGGTPKKKYKVTEICHDLTARGSMGHPKTDYYITVEEIKK